MAGFGVPVELILMTTLASLASCILARSNAGQ
jgi:hypothetical protein